jgi:hydrogenase nickel incorporation protein HypA/HybF
MHELSICQALLTQVETLAAQHQAQQVTRIVVRVGPLGGVEPDLLAHAFTVARAGTVAAEAELVLETLPVRIRCQQCGVESEVEANHLCCRACGDWHTQLLSGDELLLAQVELIQ